MCNPQCDCAERERRLGPARPRTQSIKKSRTHRPTVRELITDLMKEGDLDSRVSLATSPSEELFILSIYRGQDGAVFIDLGEGI